MNTSKGAQEALARMREVIREASANRTALRIRSGGTKDFYGNPSEGAVIDPRDYAGVVAYEPSELVVTARAGTSLAQLEQTLAEQGQMLAFEPPHFGAGATLGGCVAAGLAGPRRASYGVSHGGVRDFVLGADLLDGRGELLSFGGTVMKNVAGYDVSRLLAGSLGVLGVIVAVSLKVLPLPRAECTLQFAATAEQALDLLSGWSAQPTPLSASAWYDGVLSVRLSGSDAAVTDARRRLGGEFVEPEQATSFWQSLRNHTHSFFSGEQALWRVCVPSTTPMLGLDGAQLIEWGGALRWLRTPHEMQRVRTCAAQAGGHATLFRGACAGDVFAPLPGPSLAIHRRLKAHFDPAGIFNPGRLYRDL